MLYLVWTQGGDKYKNIKVANGCLKHTAAKDKTKKQQPNILNY